MPRETEISIRRGSAAEWASSNPILESGEPGFESDTVRFKIGDGETAWNSLRYIGFDGGVVQANGQTGPGGLWRNELLDPIYTWS